MVDRKIRYITQSENFFNIPGCPVAYWVSERGFQAFQAHLFAERFYSGGRNKTHNNEKYVRAWWEIGSEKGWCRYANGGESRKWYGNDTDVVDWTTSAQNFYAQHGGLLPRENWEVEGITWSDISSSLSGYRVKPKDAKFSSSSPTLIAKNGECDYTMLAFLNSIVAAWMIEITNPTLHTLVGNILALPDKIEDCNVDLLASSSVGLSKSDWDSFEISRDFRKHPLM